MHRSASQPRLRGSASAVVAAVAMVSLVGCAGDPAIARFGSPGPREARRVQLGHSVEGRALYIDVLGAGPATTLVIGGIHGDESVASDVAQRLAEFLDQNPQATPGRAVAVLAVANPDGAARHTRTNAHGVDLNRNFPAGNWRVGRKGRRDYGGPAPASEPETQALIRAVELLHPDRIFSFHCRDNGGPCNNYDGPAAGLARLLAARNGYPVLASIGHPTPGSLGTWAGVDRGIPIITLELPRGRSAAACWEQNREALLAAVAADLDSPTATSPRPP